MQNEVRNIKLNEVNFNFMPNLKFYSLPKIPKNEIIFLFGFLIGQSLNKSASVFLPGHPKLFYLHLRSGSRIILSIENRRESDHYITNQSH
jgi:hypothetical protein